MENYELYMRRCIDIANNGLGNTFPNPLVGSVIVCENRIIGEGYHTKSGLPHAEINAINSVKDKSLLKKSTLYVNLEPCSHYGKTPPCAIKIAELGIPKVVIGTIDTTDKVKGKGIQILRNAGVEVITGVLEKEAREINKRFFTYHEKKRPYIILKWAQTVDSYIAPHKDIRQNIEPFWITGKNERTLVHKWRTEEEAILIGSKTLEYDNPKLNVRNWNGNNPMPFIVGNNIDFNLKYNLFEKGENVSIFTKNVYAKIPKNTNIYQIFDEENITGQIIDYLYSLKIQSIIVEGGAFTHNKFIEIDMWDEARIFIGKKYFGNGIKIADINMNNVIKKTEFRDSTLFFLNNFL